MKKIVSLLLALALYAGMGVPALAAGFSDVPAGHYAAGAIESCVARGIVSGYADGTFRPDQPVTNAQFAVMMARAFFPEDLAEFEAQGKAEGRPWHWGAIELLSSKKVDHDSMIEGTWRKNADKPITRFDMAKALYNLLLYRGVKPPSEQTKAAYEQFSDNDFDFRVGTPCCLGIINGYPDGTFGGKKTMNRAQACAVIDRTAKIIGYAADRPTTVEAVRNPSTYKPGRTIDGVLTDGWIAWTVSDNAYPDGTLNNGKPATEENVLEMLKEAEKIWPTDLPWGGNVNGYELNNSYYYSYNQYGLPRSITADVLEKNVGTNASLGCGGFACMVSDYIFGQQGNPPRRLEDNMQVRPGDIICIMSDGKNTHVEIALTTPVTYKGIPAVYNAGGNLSGTVSWGWPGILSNPTRIDTYMGGMNNAHKIEKYIYTRYPE